MWPRPSFFPECAGIGVGSGSNVSVVVSGSFGGTDFSKWDVSVGILCSALWFLVSTLPGFEPGIAGCHRHTCVLKLTNALSIGPQGLVAMPGVDVSRLISWQRIFARSVCPSG